MEKVIFLVKFALPAMAIALVATQWRRRDVDFETENQAFMYRMMYKTSSDIVLRITVAFCLMTLGWIVALLT